MADSSNSWMTKAPKMARVTSKSILMTLTFRACQADAAIGKPPMREAARSRPDSAASLLNNHFAAKARTIKMPVAAVSRLRFFINHFCIDLLTSLL